MITLSKDIRQETSRFAPLKELSMDLQHRLPVELCGPYAGEEAASRQVCCWLQVGHAKVAVQLSTEVLRDSHLHDRGEIVLHVPNQRPMVVEPQAILTPSQQNNVHGWTAEMENFDRF
jgi:hypothetical protein